MSNSGSSNTDTKPPLNFGFTIFKCKWCSRAFQDSQVFVDHKKKDHPVEFSEYRKQLKALKKEKQNKGQQVETSKRSGEDAEDSKVNSITSSSTVKTEDKQSIITSLQDGIKLITNELKVQVKTEQQGTSNQFYINATPSTFVPKSNRDSKDVQGVHATLQSNTHRRSSDSSREEISDSAPTEIIEEEQQMEKRVDEIQMIPEDNEDQKRILYKCKECKMSYSNHSQLVLHETRHSKPTQKSSSSKKKKGSFVCSYCNRKMSSLRSLQDHESIMHTGQLTHKCDFCEKYFATTSQKFRHTRKHHEGINTCSAADFACVKEYFLLQQKSSKSTSTTPLKPIKVPSTAKPNPITLPLNRPGPKSRKMIPQNNQDASKGDSMNISSPHVTQKINQYGKVAYMCAFCRKEFSGKLGAIAHLPKHTRERNFTCRWCSKTFMYDRDRKTHEKNFHPTQIKAELRAKLSERNYNQPSQAIPNPLKSRMTSSLPMKSRMTSLPMKSRMTSSLPMKSRMTSLPMKSRMTSSLPMKSRMTSSLPMKKRGGPRKYSKHRLDLLNATLRQYSLSLNSHWSEFYTRSIPGSSALVCKICTGRFNGESLAVDHINVHTGQKPYECDYCDSIFSYKRNRTSHVRSQHADKVKAPKKKSHSPPKSTSHWENYLEFTSEETDFNLAIYNSSQEQEEKEEDVSKYIVSQPFNGKQVHVCSFCKNIFDSLLTALNHVKSMHTGQKVSSETSLKDQMKKPMKKNYKCEDCSKYFGYSHTLKRHRINAHKSFKSIQSPVPQQRPKIHGPVRANFTSSSISTSNSLKLITRRNTRSFVCKVCSKVSPSHANAVRHLRIHTGERPFACTYKNCDQRFIDNWALRKHQSVHTGKKLHFCSVCPEEFDLKNQLIVHMKTHETPLNKFHPQIKNVYSIMNKNDDAHDDESGDSDQSISDNEAMSDEDSAFSSPGNNTHHRPSFSGSTISNPSQPSPASKYLQKGEKSFFCTLPNCDRAFIDMHQLNKHQKNHSNEQNNLSSISIHLPKPEQQSKKNTTKIRPTPTNDDSLKDNRLIPQSSPYVSEKLIGEDIKYVCNFCQKPYDLLRRAIEHSTSHTGETPYKCKCGKAFCHSSSLYRHRLKCKNS